MSKRWLGWIVLAVLGWANDAQATITSNPVPINVGNVDVNTTGMVAAELQSSGTDALDHFSFSGADCARFNLIASVPVTIMSGTPLAITVEFTPNRRGLATCDVTARNMANGSLGTFQLQGTGVAADISTTAPPINFGSVRVANAATLTSTQNVVITNIGDTGHPLAISDLSISGTHASDYTITSSTPPPNINVNPAASTTVIVVFNPSASGTRTASLDITSNDPLTPNVSVALTGAGTNAVITANNLAFNIVTQGTIATGNVVVQNTGALPTGTLRVTSATIAGGSWFTFDANGGGCTNMTTCGFGGGLNITTSANVVVRCAPPPNATGSQLGTVTFASDTDAGGDSVAALSCTAGRADIGVNTMALAFGDVLINTSSPPQIVLVSNSGNQNLTFTATKSPNTSVYALAGCFTGCVVTPGGMQMFMVTFTPTAPGNVPININIAAPADPDNPTTTISVTGRGVAPGISAPGSIAFGSVEVGKTSAGMILTVTNTGTANLNINSASVTLGPADFIVVSGTTGVQTVSPSGTASWTVVCTPQSFGPRPNAGNGQFQISSDAYMAPLVSVTLTCTGQQGVLATTPTSLNFGGVAEQTTATLSFTLRNTGNVPVNGITAVVNPATTGYSVDPTTPVPTTLGAGASSSPLNIRFAPLSGADGGPATVTFTGNWGVTPTTTMAVLNLDGDGLTTGYDVTPSTINFGNLRFDTTPTRTFCIVNTQQAAFNLPSISITPGMGTMTGEFTVISMRRQAVCGSGGTAETMLPLPVPLGGGQILEITVRADPANRVGMMNAVVTVTSTLMANPTRTVTLVGMATTATMSVSPGALVNYNTVDVQGTAATQMVTISNTGAANLDLANFQRTVNPAFQFAIPPNTTLAPSQQLSFMVSYLPTTARPAGQEETVTISHTIGGDITAPGAGMITLQGRGIDRDLVLGPTPVFADSYRNPDVDGPIGATMVSNPGEAPLAISVVMVTNNPEVWELLDPNPVDVAGGANTEFRVRFKPTMVGSFTATLRLVNDDDDNGPPTMVKNTDIMLQGTCLSRKIAIDPRVIDLGFTAVGDTVTIPSEFRIINTGPDEFGVTDITVANPVFSVTVPDESKVPANTTTWFAVSFTPQDPGIFSTTAQTFFDSDEIADGMGVELRGTAVFADARGGGGCSTGRGIGAGVLVIVLAVLARRRRRAAPVALLAVLIVPADARAEDATENIALSVFDPTPSTSIVGFQVQSPEVGNHGDFAVSSVFSYATDPLFVVVYDPMTMAPMGTANVVERSAFVEVGAAFAFRGKYEFAARMPFYNQAGEAAAPDKLVDLPVQPATGTARGDLTLSGKRRLARKVLTGNGLASFAAGVHLTLPTATDAQLTGTDLPSARALAMGLLIPGAFSRRVTLSGNLGFVLRVPATYYNVEQRSGIAFGLGLSIRVLDRVWMSGETFGDMVPSGREPTHKAPTTLLSPSEWLAGLRWHPDHRFAVSLAAGRGMTSSVGAPSIRGVLALTVSPGAPEIRPIHPRKPDTDDDGDGILNSRDKCDNEAEDKDLFDDADGCPDPDNDKDGVADAQDMCPIDAEDRDNFEDSDGCAETDNDKDGIVDAQDKCPTEAEDKDGNQDVDGCPDNDNDRDGVLDAKDLCPDKPETINGVQDDDGCPDAGDSQVVLSPDRVEVLGAIQFTGTKLSKTSFRLLGQVAATLRAHPEIMRVRVTCHVQPTNDPDKDQALSDKRAQAVREWLVQWGLPAHRIEMRGLGGTKPLVPRASRGAQQLNDRIELIILERK